MGDTPPLPPSETVAQNNRNEEEEDSMILERCTDPALLFSMDDSLCMKKPPSDVIKNSRYGVPVPDFEYFEDDACPNFGSDSMEKAEEMLGPDQMNWMQEREPRGTTFITEQERDGENPPVPKKMLIEEIEEDENNFKTTKEKKNRENNQENMLSKTWSRPRKSFSYVPPALQKTLTTSSNICPPACPVPLGK